MGREGYEDQVGDQSLGSLVPSHAFRAASFSGAGWTSHDRGTRCAALQGPQWPWQQRASSARMRALDAQVSFSVQYALSEVSGPPLSDLAGKPINRAATARRERASEQRASRGCRRRPWRLPVRASAQMTRRLWARAFHVRGSPLSRRRRQRRRPSLPARDHTTAAPTCALSVVSSGLALSAHNNCLSPGCRDTLLTTITRVRVSLRARPHPHWRFLPVAARPGDLLSVRLVSKNRRSLAVPGSLPCALSLPSSLVLQWSDAANPWPSRCPPPTRPLLVEWPAVSPSCGRRRADAVAEIWGQDTVPKLRLPFPHAAKLVPTDRGSVGASEERLAASLRAHLTASHGFESTRVSVPQNHNSTSQANRTQALSCFLSCFLFGLLSASLSCKCEPTVGLPCPRDSEPCVPRSIKRRRRPSSPKPPCPRISLRSSRSSQLPGRCPSPSRFWTGDTTPLPDSAHLSLSMSWPSRANVTCPAILCKLQRTAQDTCK
ncbi:hypothetical protein BCR34DRAFT_588161 [Clohesyomyces aquaticus]|uniref:Uncharacterized protein n=1 Tax=Clohesyomyces aquaticus TaxID=1231657 RepID=A0A1Y1ZL86_9PLEO|nr:hypothetical protein BCR34DRAFT_588161 [Clohesyomyces aquaticus]